MPDSLAPTHANWGWDNRTTFIRIPPERGGATRLEIRVGDGGANPYLAIAAVLAAGTHGIREKLEPPPPVERRRLPRGARRDRRRAAALARGRARRARGRRRPVRRARPGDRRRPFLAVKRFEVERHRAWVSDWEIDEYLHHL